MRTILFLLSFLSLGLAASIWPIPASLKTGKEVVWFTRQTQFEYSGPQSVESAPASNPLILAGACFETAAAISTPQQVLTPCLSVDEQTDAKYFKTRIQKAIDRAQTHILSHSFVPWKFYPRGAEFEPSKGDGVAISKVKLVQTDKEKRAPKIGEVDESYTLELKVDGKKSASATITAKSSIGLMHGLETFKQLFYKHSAGGVYSAEAPVKISDSPKFPHRGLNLDVARQWYPVESIKKQIDALAINKFNRLHFHVTDSQSWPLEIPAMPELAEKGAYYKGLTYSPKDIQGILDYAEDRGIQVYIEIDMPGHTTSIAESHPELIVAKNKQPDWDKWAAQPPSGTLKLNDPAVDKFVKKLLEDLLPRLKKHTTYYHSGGDEVNKNAYTLDPGVNSADPLVIQPFINRFVNNAHKVVHDQGFSPVVWEEMLLDWNITLSKDTIVQVWQDATYTKRVVQAGYKAIASSYHFWYLDCGNGQWLDFTAKTYQTFYPFNDYCSPKKSWRLVYSYDPIASLTPEEAKLVQGGEVSMWSEQTDAINVEQQVWPRASAAGEVLWSGRKDAQGVNRTFEEASPRLGEMRERLVQLGVGAAPIMQLWCHQNKGGCQL